MDNNTENEVWLNSTILRAIKKMKLAGLRHAFKPGMDWTERLWWVGVFFLCLGFTAFLTVKTINEYEENPVLYTFHDDEPSYNVAFPATTITGTMIFKNNALDEATALYLKTERIKEDVDFQFEGKTWTHPLVDILIFTIDHLCQLVKSFASRNGFIDQPFEEFNLRKNAYWMEAKKNVSFQDNIKDEGIRNNIAPFLKSKTLDCKDILLACSWEGSKENCTDIFVPIQTDVGSGCSFNRIPEELLSKQRGLMSLLQDHEHNDDEVKAWKKFTAERLDSAISVNGMHDFMETIRPRAQRHAGKLRGLPFMVKFDEDVDGMSCPIVDSNGYLLGIHSPFEKPQMLKTGVGIPPRHEIFVDVNADVTIADKEIESLHISKRKCYFQKENLLENFKVYTVGNCHQECLGRTIQQNCKCALLTRSAGKNETLCGPMDQDCVKNATAYLEKGRYDNLCVNPICYPPCNEVKYGADASYLPYHKKDTFYVDKLRKNPITSIIHVAFDSDSVSTRRRKLQYGFAFIVGVLGGLWGMTLEFSVFTFFNVLAGIGVLILSSCVWKKLERDEENENVPCDEAPEEIPRGNDEDNRNEHSNVPCVLAIENETDERPSIEEETPGMRSIGKKQNNTCDNEPSTDTKINENQNKLVQGFSSLSSDMDDSLSVASFSADSDSATTSTVRNNIEYKKANQPPDQEIQSPTVQTEPAEDNLAAGSESGSSFRDPIGWDQLLDEIFELVEI